MSQPQDAAPEARPTSPVRGPARPGPYVVAGVMVVLAIVLPLWVPMYARHDPTLGGFPFFYWYQLLWVFIASGLLWIGYTVMIKEDRRRRAAVRGQQGTGTGTGSDESTDGGAR